MSLGRRLRRRRPPSSRSRYPWLAPVMLLALVVNLTAIGYRLTEGWDWGDCYWMVAITIPGIGYGEVEPLSAAGRVVTVFSILGGLAVVQLSLQLVLGLSDSGYFRRARQRRFLHWLRTMQDHVIVCGYGRIGREIAEQLLREQVPLLVLELDPELQAAAQARGIPVLLADATRDETLHQAGIQRCRSLVAALSSDAANLYVVLSARGIAPRCRLIARCDNEEAARKLRQAGANQVISPYVAGGRAMASTALRPLSVGFLDLLAGSDCEVEEFQLSNDPRRLHSVAGRSLADLEIKARTGVLVLAIQQPSDLGSTTSYRGIRQDPVPAQLIANPPVNIRLGPGQLLVVMGSRDQLARLRELLGEAVVEECALPA
ncbi:MAG: potassium channel protein [Cyanobacteriota bacterium]|nr:potassium channel protein [Cyanobacteriota bacterium]